MGASSNQIADGGVSPQIAQLANHEEAQQFHVSHNNASIMGNDASVSQNQEKYAVKTYTIDESKGANSDAIT